MLFSASHLSHDLELGNLVPGSAGFELSHPDRVYHRRRAGEFLILVGILPAQYALNPASKPETLHSIVKTAESVQPCLVKMGPNPITGQQAVDTLSDYLKTTGVASRQTWEAIAGLNEDVHDRIAGKKTATAS